jgi:hypothetical protein
MMRSDPNNKMIRLNVGGTRYDLSKATLEKLDKRCQGSFLKALIMYGMSEEKPDEPIFIDRNGRLFESVLDYMRTGMIYLSPSVNITALKDEFIYYGISASWDKSVVKNVVEHLDESDPTTQLKYYKPIKEIKTTIHWNYIGILKAVGWCYVAWGLTLGVGIMRQSSKPRAY